MIKFHIFMIVFFITLTFTSVKAQVISQDEINILDSLLIIEEIAQINDFFDRKEYEIEKANFGVIEMENYQKIKSEYLRIINQINNLYEISDENIDQLIIHNLKLSKNFNENLSGKKACDIYNNFLLFVNENKKIEALKYSFLAYYYKTKHIQNLKEKVKENIEIAHTKFEERRYEEAYQIIKEVELDIKYYAIFKTERNHLKFFKKEIEKKINKRKIKEELWKQSETVDYSWIIYISSQFIIGADNKDVSWKFYDGSYSFNHVGKKITTLWRYSYSVGIERHITKKCRIGINYGNGEAHRCFLTQNNWQIRHSVIYSSFQINSQYIFRNKVGLRPYTGLGLGIMKSKREKLNVSGMIFDLYYPVNVNEEKKTFVQLLVELGAEYVPSSKSKITYKLFFPFYYCNQKKELLSNISFGFGLKIGFGFK